MHLRNAVHKAEEILPKVEGPSRGKTPESIETHHVTCILPRKIQWILLGRWDENSTPQNKTLIQEILSEICGNFFRKQEVADPVSDQKKFSCLKKHLVTKNRAPCSRNSRKCAMAYRELLPKQRSKNGHFFWKKKFPLRHKSYNRVGNAPRSSSSTGWWSRQINRKYEV